QPPQVVQDRAVSLGSHAREAPGGNAGRRESAGRSPHPSFCPAAAGLIQVSVGKIEKASPAGAAGPLPVARGRCYIDLFRQPRTRAIRGVGVMGARRIRREQRREDMAHSRRTNGMRKMHERARRKERMLELIKKGKLPYTPSVMSWLSA